MTTNPNHPDLLAVAEEAQVEIAAAEVLQGPGMPLDAAGSFATAELGYYEAELRSLRGAATRLDEADRSHDVP